MSLSRLVDHVADVYAGDVDAHHADLVRALDHVDELVHRRVAPQRDLRNGYQNDKNNRKL